MYHVYIAYTMIPTLHPPQDGDTAVIMATQDHHSEALKELVAAGADLNPQNMVTYQ